MVRSFNRPSTAISSKNRLREKATYTHGSSGDYVSARYIGPIYLTAIMTCWSTNQGYGPLSATGSGSSLVGVGCPHPPGGDRDLTRRRQALRMVSFVTMTGPCEGSPTTRLP